MRRLTCPAHQTRCLTQAYLSSKLRQFGGILARQVNPGLNGDQIRHAIDHAMAYMMQQDAAAAPQRSLRLVIRHDCQ